MYLKTMPRLVPTLHSHTHPCRHACTRLYICTDTHEYEYIDMSKSVYIEYIADILGSVYICICICNGACMHVCTCVFMYLCMYVCTCVRVHVCVYVRRCVCMYVFMLVCA